MLAKLIKLEFKSTYQKFLPLYLILLVFTVMGVINLNYGLPPGENSFYDAVNGLLVGFYVLSLIAVVIVTGVLIVMRFYKNFITDQGYLMFTLPATVEQQVLAKLIVAFVWSSISSFVFLLSLTVLFGTQTIPWNDVFLSIHQAYEMALYQFGGQFNLLLILLILALILSPLNSILMYYLSMSIGQLSRTHKVITSIGAYLGITIALQLVSSLLTTLLMPGYFRMFENVVEPTPEKIFGFVNNLSILSIVTGVILTVVFYFLTCYILKHKLNLE